MAIETPKGLATSVNLTTSIDTNRNQGVFNEVSPDVKFEENTGMFYKGQLVPQYKQELRPSVGDPFLYTYFTASGKRVQILLDEITVGVPGQTVYNAAPPRLPTRVKINPTYQGGGFSKIYDVKNEIFSTGPVYLFGVSGSTTGLFTVNTVTQACTLVYSFTPAEEINFGCISTIPATGSPAVVFITRVGAPFSFRYYTYYSGSLNTITRTGVDPSGSILWINACNFENRFVITMTTSNIGAIGNTIYGTLGAAFTPVYGQYLVESKTGTSTLAFLTWTAQASDLNPVLNTRILLQNSGITVTNVDPGSGNAIDGGNSGPGFVFRNYTSQINLSYGNGDEALGYPTDQSVSQISPAENSFFSQPAPYYFKDIGGANYGYTVHYLNGRPSHASTITEGMLCDVGEINPYTGSLNSDGNGSFYFMVGRTNFDSIYEVAPDIVKVGGVFVDALRGTSYYVAEGYSGELVPNNSSAGTTRIASRIKTDSAGSVDIGEQIIGRNFVTPTDYRPAKGLGFSLSQVYTYPDIFVNGEYSYTTATTINAGNIYNYQNINTQLEGTLYIENTLLPKATPTPNTSTEINLYKGTALRANNYNGYELANIISLELELFYLYGQLYGFDGDFIYTVPVSAGLITGSIDRSCPAGGMRFLCSSPILAYFYSNYDGSVYTFDGGRNLNKFMVFSNYSEVVKAIFSVTANALVMIFPSPKNSVIIRDNIVSSLAGSYISPALRLVDTKFGAMILLLGGADAYFPRDTNPAVITGATSVLRPLTFRSGLYAAKNNNWIKMNELVIVFENFVGNTQITLSASITFSYTLDSGQNTNVTTTKSITTVSGTTPRIRYTPPVDSVATFKFELLVNSTIAITEIVMYTNTMGPINIALSSTIP